MSPCVSVIIPAYNAGAVVGETCGMLARQTLADFEVIVVDDGSQDDTAAIVTCIAETDDRFRLVRQQNAGAAAARNAGFALARGTYVCFLDADDIYDERLLEDLVAALEETGADLAVCEADIYHMETDDRKSLFRFAEGLSEGRHVRSDFGRRLFQSFNKTPWNKLYRKDFLEATGILFQSLPNMNDTFFVEGNLALAGAVAILKAPLVAYRRGLGTSLQDRRATHPDCALRAASALFDELMGRGTLGDDEVVSLKNECWRLAITAEETALTTKDYDTVADLLSQVRALAESWDLDVLARRDFALIEYWLWYVCFMRVSVRGLMWAYDLKRRPVNEKQSTLTNVRCALRLTLASATRPDRAFVRERRRRRRAGGR